MEDSNLPAAATISTVVPNPPIERPWIVKITVLMLIGSIVSSMLSICTSIADLRLPPILALLLPAYIAFQGFTAWGLWQMKELARKALIILVIINAIGLVYKIAQSAAYDPALALFAVAAGFALRGAFVYWLLENKRLFRE